MEHGHRSVPRTIKAGAFGAVAGALVGIVIEGISNNWVDPLGWVVHLWIGLLTTVGLLAGFGVSRVRGWLDSRRRSEQLRGTFREVIDGR